MRGAALDAAVVAAWLGATVWLGARARRRGGVEDFVVASRALTFPGFVAALVPAFYGGVLGVGEFAWTSGLSNWTVMALPYYVFAALYAWLLAARVRTAPGLSVADHLEGAYGRPAALAGAVLVFALSAPADEALMAGALLSHLTGLPVAACAAAAVAAALALVWRGGLPSDVAANRLQLVGMYAGFAALLPFCVAALGPPSALPASLPPSHLTWTGGLRPGALVGWWLIAAWTLVDPAFHQRCAAAESPAVARRGILASIAFWAVFDLMTTTAGLYARAALPSLDAPALAFPRLADAVLPPLARGIFLAGLASSIFAGLQAAALLAGAALGRDLAGRLRPGRAPLPALRAGLVAAGLLALLLAWAVPSITGLWYLVGSACVPGLLLPMLGTYHPRLRASPRWALAASLSGSGLSFAWVAAARSAGAPPLGLEPMLPGLALSGALWAAGLYSSKRAATDAPAITPQAPQ